MEMGKFELVRIWTGVRYAHVRRVWKSEIFRERTKGFGVNNNDNTTSSIELLIYGFGLRAVEWGRWEQTCKRRTQVEGLPPVLIAQPVYMFTTTLTHAHTGSQPFSLHPCTGCKYSRLMLSHKCIHLRMYRHWQSHIGMRKHAYCLRPTPLFHN